MISARLILSCILFITGPAVAFALTPKDVDESLNASFKDQALIPANQTTDAEFLRRVSLDVRGVIPTIEETIAFLQDEAPNKREVLVENFLNDPLRGENWAAYWDKVLVGTLEQPESPAAQNQLKQQWKAWVAQQFETNVPYNTFAAEIISATGKYPADAQVLPMARWRDSPESMAGTVSRVFLGQQIQCAQCHDHKTNPELTQKKFWEFASFYGTTRVTPVRNAGATTMNSMMESNAGLYVFDGGLKWESVIPDTKTKVTPTYLDGTEAKQEFVDGNGKTLSAKGRRELAQNLKKWNEQRKAALNVPGASRNQVLGELLQQMPDYHDTRRDQLAKMMTVNDQDQFARNFVNRLWARYFGRGFLDPVDDWGMGYDPVQGGTLELLSQEFIRSGYNVKHLEWIILNTAAYQRSTTPTQSSREFPEAFAHALVRPLSAEQVLNSFFQAMSISTNRAEGQATKSSREKRDQALMDRYEVQFIQALNNDEMEWVNTFETSVPKSLFLINDLGINKAIDTTKGNLLDRIEQAAGNNTKEAVDYLFLGILSRYPTPQESESLTAELASMMQANPKEARLFAEDLTWALLNSTEFMTNH